MIVTYVLTVMFLRVWLVGLAIFALVSVSDFLFRLPHSVGRLGGRLALAMLWPLALASSAGRQALLGAFGFGARKPARFQKMMLELKKPWKGVDP
jgi:hypothetical protein